MCVDEFLGELICFLFLAVRSKETLKMLWEMGVPKWQARGEEQVVQKLNRTDEVSASKVSRKYGKTAQRERKQHRDFDSTKGFPGEDLQPETVVDFICN